jgi:GT2 family glycosyltransferase
MIRRLLRAARRLVSAVVRHGPGPVVRFSLAMLQRHGPFGAVRYALLRGQPAQAQGELADQRDLDGRFSLSESAWRAFLASVQGAQAYRQEAAEDRSKPVRFAYVIEGEGRTELELTRASIHAVKSNSGERRIINSGAGGDLTDLSADGYVVFLRAGDRIDPDFESVVARSARAGRVEIVTFDLVCREDGRVRPLFLPGVNPTLCRNAPELYARFAIAAAACPQGDAGPGGLATAIMSDWLTSRPGEVARGRWRHVGGAPLVEIAAMPATPAMRPGVVATKSPPSVSVVICTKDKGHLTRQLVRGLLANQPAVVDIVVVSNNTTSPHGLATLRDLAEDPRVTVIRRDEPFNFSKLCNAGARLGRGSHLLFLNDDIVAVTEDWLARLMAHLEAPDVGTVGPLLVYPNERVQHAGMHLGLGRSAGHTLRNARLPDDEYGYLASAAREVSSVTGAVLLTPRHLFEALNGFDERLATLFQDVDYCLRARQGGFVNVFEPAAVLIHLESVSVLERPLHTMDAQRGREHVYFVQRWGDALDRGDPYFPAGLDPNDETLHSLRPSAEHSAPPV